MPHGVLLQVGVQIANRSCCSCMLQLLLRIASLTSYAVLLIASLLLPCAQKNSTSSSMGGGGNSRQARGTTPARAAAGAATTAGAGTGEQQPSQGEGAASLSSSSSKCDTLQAEQSDPSANTNISRGCGGDNKSGSSSKHLAAAGGAATALPFLPSPSAAATARPGENSHAVYSRARDAAPCMHRESSFACCRTKAFAVLLALLGVCSNAVQLHCMRNGMQQEQREQQQELGMNLGTCDWRGGVTMVTSSSSSSSSGGESGSSSSGGSSSPRLGAVGRSVAGVQAEAQAESEVSFESLAAAAGAASKRPSKGAAEGSAAAATWAAACTPAAASINTEAAKQGMRGGTSYSFNHLVAGALTAVTNAMVSWERSSHVLK